MSLIQFRRFESLDDFVGTRVPLQNLIDYLEGGESIEDFLDGVPSVKRAQVVAVIEAAKLKMLETV